MPEFLVILAIDGTAHARVRASSQQEAEEAAAKTPIDDVTWDHLTITALHAEVESE